MNAARAISWNGNSGIPPPDEVDEVLEVEDRVVVEAWMKSIEMVFEEKAVRLYLLSLIPLTVYV